MLDLLYEVEGMLFEALDKADWGIVEEAYGDVAKRLDADTERDAKGAGCS